MHKYKQVECSRHGVYQELANVLQYVIQCNKVYGVGFVVTNNNNNNAHVTVPFWPLSLPIASGLTLLWPS